jgi:hypothetical protein
LLVLLEFSMPCQEFIELEASSQRFTERRNKTVETSGERCAGKPAGYRAGEARYAYILMLRLQNCAVCRG